MSKLRPTGTLKMRFLNHAGWVSVWIMYTVEGSKVSRRGAREASAGENGGGIGLVADLTAFCFPFGGIVRYGVDVDAQLGYDVGVNV